MFSNFFIDRPIFATVLSIVIVILGLVAYFQLPIAQYPEVAPPVVQVSAIYPGANAKTVGTDSNGNTVSYVIHRMCEFPGPFNNNCAQVSPTLGGAGNGQSVGDNAFVPLPLVFFRVTVRVEGPRSTVAIVQSNIGLQF